VDFLDVEGEETPYCYLHLCLISCVHSFVLPPLRLFRPHPTRSPFPPLAARCSHDAIRRTRRSPRMSGVTQRAWRVDGFHGTRHSDSTLTSAADNNNNIACNGLFPYFLWRCGWGQVASSQRASLFFCLLAFVHSFPFPSRIGASDEHDARHTTRSRISTIHYLLLDKTFIEH